MENDADLQNKTNIPPKDLLDITEFLLTKTWFLFDGTFFKQTSRVAMGCPASSVVAELYMQNHDNRTLTTVENSPRIYERFVDDIVIKLENLKQFHNHMNTFHPKIQFTIEEESDGELPFLDT